jgi:hypothetical protein
VIRIRASESKSSKLQSYLALSYTRHFSSTRDDEDDEYTSLDRLLRFKPAIIHKEKVDDNEGIPESENLEPGQERDPRYMLGRKLLKLGKVNFRHIEYFPDWLSTRLELGLGLGLGCFISFR